MEEWKRGGRVGAEAGVTWIGQCTYTDGSLCQCECGCTPGSRALQSSFQRLPRILSLQYCCSNMLMMFSWGRKKRALAEARKSKDRGPGALPHQYETSLTDLGQAVRCWAVSSNQKEKPSGG